jgi:hypothetical protein
MVRISWSWMGLYEHLTKQEKADFQKCLKKLRELEFVKETESGFRTNDSQYDYYGVYEALKASTNTVRRIISVYNKMVEIQLAIHERFKPLIAEKKIGKRFSWVSREAFNISIARIEMINELQLTHAAQTIINELAVQQKMIRGGYPWSGKNHYFLEIQAHGLDSDYVYKSETGVKANKPLDRILNKAKNLVAPFNVKVESMRMSVHDGRISIEFRLKVM